MIVRRLIDLNETDREVKAPNGNWVSRRFLLKGDNVGFSMHDTLIHAGTETYIWYKYHVEAVYCVSGKGEIENLETGEIHNISDGTIYVLNLHERHYLRAYETMRLICVFNPPIVGNEVHTEEGYYDLPKE
ncbi:ectoine synthase [Spirosoma sp. SC4-14]|uniref:ectoine synthase n=1 Tax=Spirosoma sp. SC4-14 TaxID=3128900 RepID=UPI0030CA8835